MAERSSIFQVVQVGKETTPGTSVAANKRLLATNFEIGAVPEISIFRPSGYKFATVSSLNKESVRGSISGQLSYTDIVYLLSSLVRSVTPSTVDVTGQKWVFSSDSDGPDTPVTFTVEQGSSVRAHRFTYGLVTGLELTFDDEGAEVSGTIIGKALEDDIVLTSPATEVALVPVTRPQILIYLASTAAGLGSALPLARPLSASWSLTDRFNPLWPLNGDTSFGAHTEVEPTGQVTLLLEADAEGMDLLDTMRKNDTKFMRIEATGDTIGVGPATYSLTIDSAFKVEDVSEFRDEQGVYAIEWTGRLAHDSTWGKAFEISVINALTAL